jgi:hypothetical protein
MTSNRLLELMNRMPFQPLEIHLSDGAAIRVEQPFEISTEPNSPTLVIHGSNNQMRIVSLRNITEVITTELIEP